MSTQGDAFLSYLATINDKATPDPPSENDPIQKVSTPFEKVAISDAATAAVGAGRPFTYGAAKYGQAQYGS